MNHKKYQKTSMLPLMPSYSWVLKERPDLAPIWCSVDLRDGNQALITPMTGEEKLEYLGLLIKLGFKQIEVGFPAQSDDEFDFVSGLSDIEDTVGDCNDIYFQVFSSWRPNHIERTFEAIKGFKNVIVHIASTVSDSYSQIVLGKSREEIRLDILETAAYLKRTSLDFLKKAPDTNLILEFSPEGFTNTSPEFALDVINSVIELLLPEFAGRLIINIPSTVENTYPHVFATQIEYISRNLLHRKDIILSIHSHNDMGSAVAATELALLAGAERVEGTLFGNGERTGNVDIVTMALNLLANGIDPELDLSNLPYIRDVYERVTGFTVPPRHPYAGDLVFTSLSAPHQNAIAKAMQLRANRTGRPEVEDSVHDDSLDVFADTVHNVDKFENVWNVPYLPIDPADIGRTYEGDVIKINSISGKGGVSYLLRTHSGFILPEKMKSEVSDTVKEVLSGSRLELSADRVYEIFDNKYIKSSDIFNVPACHFRQTDGIYADVTIHYNHENYTITSGGNGRLDATSNAIKQFFELSYELSVYEEHALSNGSSAAAAAYVAISFDNRLYWGVGIDSDIIKASINALVIAVNALLRTNKNIASMKNLMVLIMNYIKNNYETVTLNDLVDAFHFTKPYLSKYIKENSGQTFGQIVRELRMNKACDMLKNTRMTVEAIALKSGYPTPEHFTRLFKKTYGMTPLQFRAR